MTFPKYLHNNTALHSVLLTLHMYHIDTVLAPRSRDTCCLHKSKNNVLECSERGVTIDAIDNSPLCILSIEARIEISHCTMLSSYAILGKQTPMLPIHKVDYGRSSHAETFI